jgi:hypothetical protein
LDVKSTYSRENAKYFSPEVELPNQAYIPLTVRDVVVARCEDGPNASLVLWLLTKVEDVTAPRRVDPPGESAIKVIPGV